MARRKTPGRPELRKKVVEEREIKFNAAFTSLYGRFPREATSVSKILILRRAIEAKRVDWKIVDPAIIYVEAYLERFIAFRDARRKFINSWERAKGKSLGGTTQLDSHQFDESVRLLQQTLEQIKKRKNE